MRARERRTAPTCPDHMDSEAEAARSHVTVRRSMRISDDGLCLRDLDALALRAAVARHGVDQVVARRIFARVHRDGASTLDGVAGLSRAARESLAGVVEFPGAGDHRAAPVGRRVREVPVPPARRPGGRGGADPAARSRGRPGAEAAAAAGAGGPAGAAAGEQIHGLRQLAGGLRAGVRLLRHRAAGGDPQPGAPGRSSTRSARWPPRPTTRCAGWCSWAWASRS